MPSEYVENFMAGRRLALEQREQQQRQQQLQQQQQFAQQQEKRAQQQETRLQKAQDAQFDRIEAELKLKKLEKRDETQRGIGQGIIPLKSGITTIPERTLDLPGFEPIVTEPAQEVLNPATGGKATLYNQELAEYLDNPQYSPEQIGQFKEAEANRLLALEKEAQVHPTVVAAGRRETENARKDRIARRRKLLDLEEARAYKEGLAEINREAANKEARNRATFSSSLIADRDAKRAQQKRANKIQDIADFVESGAGESIGILAGGGQITFSMSDYDRVAAAVQAQTPGLLKKFNIKPGPNDVYLPVQREQGERLRKNITLIPTLQRVQRLATRLIKDGDVAESLLESVAGQRWEQMKGIGGFSEIEKALAPLEGDAIILARALTGDRVSKEDALAFMAQLIGLGNNLDQTQQNTDDLVNRIDITVKADLGLLPQSQIKLYWPELLKLEGYKDIGNPNRKTDPDAANIKPDIPGVEQYRNNETGELFWGVVDPVTGKIRMVVK